jgi:hypothetical protein
MRDARSSNRSNGWRIPAGVLEDLVIKKVRAFLADPTTILDAIDHESQSGSGQSQLIERGRQIADELGAGTPDKVKATLIALLCRVAISPDRKQRVSISGGWTPGSSNGARSWPTVRSAFAVSAPAISSHRVMAE